MVPRQIYKVVIKYGKSPFTMVEVGAFSEDSAIALVKENVNFEAKAVESKKSK